MGLLTLTMSFIYFYYLLFIYLFIYFAFLTELLMVGCNNGVHRVLRVVVREMQY